MNTVMPYKTVDEAVELAKLGRGSLVGSLFTSDDKLAKAVVLGTASHHGRIMMIDKTSAKSSTGHGSPLPGLVHPGSSPLAAGSLTPHSCPIGSGRWLAVCTRQYQAAGSATNPRGISVLRSGRRRAAATRPRRWTRRIDHPRGNEVLSRWDRLHPA